MKKIIRLVLLFSGVGCLAWFSVGSGQDKLDPFVVTTPVTKNNLDSIIASGNLAFENEVQLRPEITGVVEHVYVEPGSIVKKGDLLLSLEQTELNMSIAAAEADLKIVAIQLERYKEIEKELKRRFVHQRQLNEKKVVSTNDLLSLKSELAISALNVRQTYEEQSKYEAEYSRIKELFEKTMFRSPIDGVVLSVDVKPGEAVIAGTTNIIGSSILTIADPNSLVAKLRVDEADISTVKLEQAVNIYVASNPNKVITGKVTSIGLTAKSRETGTGLYYQVDVDFTAERELLSGMSCRGELILDQESNVMTLPLSSIQYEDKRAFVWIVIEDIVKRKYIDVGLSTDTEQSILSGLDVNDRVIIGPTRAMMTLKEGESIAVIQS